MTSVDELLFEANVKSVTGGVFEREIGKKKFWFVVFFVRLKDVM